MDRDLSAHFSAGARSFSPPPPRRAQPSATPSPPPRTVRVNDRAEDVVYAGAWVERIPCPAEDDDEGLEEEFAADWDEDDDGDDDEDDGDDDGAVYTPWGGYDHERGR
ncbi:hypothetical protein [Streptomyces subrutilus]|uniref:Uncharacterized protein n=1 Tax=Streptomyces subrutilus TaxID=36818 RepID=A0A1E5PXF3_9ACTN|nr:hypothetical protein [Streptomyces subrutilus]OEJ34171.1 hypothetical protein BGK67_25075 [Streptomyces subrutilus]